MLVTAIPGSPAGAAAMGPGEGLVVFTRDDKFAGKAVRFNMNVNGQTGYQLLAGSTVEIALPAGTHTFSSYSPSLDGQDSITIDVKEGWTYHVEGYVRMGWPTGRPKFRFVSETGPSASNARASSQTAAAPLAGAGLGAATTPPTAGRSAEDAGRIGLRNFAGNWNLEMWSLTADGRKLEGRGVAEGSVESNSAVRIYFTDFNAPAFPAATGGGQVRISFEQGKGFTLESHFTHSNEVLKFAGRYQPDTGRYVFHLFGTQGEIATGIPHRSTRVEVRSVDLGSWTAETYTTVDGQSVLVQVYRFSRR
jgi:hypothetical protein